MSWNPFAGQMWKFMTGGAAILSLGLSIALVVAHIQNKSLERQIETSRLRIEDPRTGLVALLAQAETNVATLHTTIKTNNETYQRRSQADADRLAKVSLQLEETQRDNRKRQQILDRVMILPPRGSSLEERYEDIDRRLLEMLK